MTRRCLAVIVFLTVSSPALAQTPQGEPRATTAPEFPLVTLGTLTYLQYAAELVESDGYNAFDVTRSYIDLKAQLSTRVRTRFTPNVKRVTDASLTERLGVGLEYAYVQVDLTPRSALAFGLHQTPWLEFEQSINRYRVQGPLFAERLNLIPGPSDIGASFRSSGERTDVHVGVYNGEGYGQTELDRHKSVQGRVTVRPYSGDSVAGGLRLSGFYSYGWYAADRPRKLAIVMGSFEHPHVVATAQYLMATENPFVAADIERRGLSLFGEGRLGPTGWAGLGGIDFIDPDRSNDRDSRRRYLVGGAHWSQWGRGRLGVVVSLEQVYRVLSEGPLERRLLVQTHVEF
ncbi:MAG: hypothetical protein HY655_04030 [Acidobacteria bacterium]|nr:hypothetical protein [Acidobacteriota bacterium]